MATFQDMLDFVRAQADADEDDAPLAVLTVNARIGYNDILSRQASWDHLEVHYTFDSVADQQEYDVTTDLSSADMDRIYSITAGSGYRYRLQWISRQDADVLFGDTTPVSGTPIYYSTYGDKIVLYPKPSGVITYTAHGFRTAETWPNGAGSEPDLPSVFHDAISFFMLQQYYTAQEDPTIAQVYQSQFEQQVRRGLDLIQGRHTSPKPRIMGGQGPAGSRGFLDRVKGSLEG